MALAILALWAGASPALAADARSAGGPRLKACFVSLNEPHELEAFRASLDPTRFEFIDVRALAEATRPPGSPPLGASGEPWLADACGPQVSCDIAVYSAEFAGRFFGRSGPSLSLQEMEEASCQPRCAGLFHQPTEVFLLACNTLANKNEDSRTPEQYLQVLIDHGFDRASAERVVQLRYGPLGPSFRESLRRVFAGVPRIYGFSSVAPRGEITAPMLSRYFDRQSDYSVQLARAGGSTKRNDALFAAFRGTSLTQTVGLTEAEAGTLDRRHICALYDESRPVAERLRTVYGLLLRPDALTFVPTLQVFLARHPPKTLKKSEKAILAEIRNLHSARDSVLDLVRDLDVSALKLELAHFAVLVGWLDHEEFHDLAVDGARRLLRETLTSEVVDIMCEITKHEPVGSEFNADDVPAELYRDPEGLRLLSCLAPSDPRVVAELLPSLDSSDPVRRSWAAHTLTRLLPRDPKVLATLVPYLTHASPDVSTRVRWVFQVQDELPKSLAGEVRKVDPSLVRRRGGRFAWLRR